ncbi:MAG: DUF2304 domain-containing protein [Lachnospiraceae bacterium]|nr:DUF2304 domain-containing protein [Lachnospiraceae bacterium]MCI9369303.1 DUF2304 domain-containing protein [Lachnospiraceae bacterium]
MTTALRIFIAVLDILGLLYILQLVRKNRLDLKYALSWLVVSIFVLIMVLFPNLMEKLAEFLGIASPVNMIFFLGFIFSLAIILILTVALSINAGSVKRLNQKIAMLDKRVRELEETKKEQGDKDEIY